MRIILDVATMYEEYGRSQQAQVQVQSTTQGTHTLSKGASSVFGLCNILSWLKNCFTGTMPISDKTHTCNERGP